MNSITNPKPHIEDEDKKHSKAITKPLSEKELDDVIKEGTELIRKNNKILEDLKEKGPFYEFSC